MVEKRYSVERPRIGAELERMVKTRAGHCCELNNCHDHTYLEVHHIDHNRENNTLENLILLCRKHHAMAHAGKIDRKSLKIYISSPGAQSINVSPLDKRAYILIVQKFSENSFFNQLQNQSFMGRLSTDFVNSIHSLEYIWQDPFSNFDDPLLNGINHRLRDASSNLAMIQLQKTFAPRGNSGYYEVPKEYEEEHYYKEIAALRGAAENVCEKYTQLIRAAVVAGIDY